MTASTFTNIKWAATGATMLLAPQWVITDSGTTNTVVTDAQVRAYAARIAENCENEFICSFSDASTSTCDSGIGWLKNNSWTWGNACPATTTSGGWTHWIAPESKEQRLARFREIIRSRMAPAVIVKGRIGSAEDIREQCARQTLRRVVGETEFRRFLTRGFVLARGKSGLVYQIFTGHSIESITNVYRYGVKVERLCVYMRGDFPPTDNLIMRYLLILNDEDQFRELANKHRVEKPAAERNTMPTPQKSLVEIYKQLKQGALT